MGVTSQLTGDSNTIKKFSATEFIDMYKKNSFGHIESLGAVHNAPELTGTNAGDQITIPLINRLTGTGIGEGGTLVGNEEGLDKEAFQMTTGIFRHAVLNPNKQTIEQNRTTVDFDRVSTELLKDFHNSRLDTSMFSQLAGSTANTITVDGTAYTSGKRLFVQGLNTPVAPTTNRIARAGGAATDQALTSTDTMNLDLIDDALVSIQGTYPTMKPLRNGMFACYLSYQQAVDLQRDSSGQIQMYQLEQSKMQGGKDSVFTNKDAYYAEDKAWGYYKNVEFYSSNRIADGQNSSTAAAITTVKRAVIIGQRALVYGSPYGTLSKGNVPLRMFTQLQDYEYYKGGEGRMNYGLKNVVQDSENLGTYVISTYSA